MYELYKQEQLLEKYKGNIPVLLLELLPEGFLIPHTTNKRQQ